MRTKFLTKEIPYFGRELSPHWIASQLGEFGSAIVAFRGACSVTTSEMVDMEDRQQKSHIEAKEMLHFIGEWFDSDLNLAVARQRLLIAGFAELLRTKVNPDLAAKISRKGNDLYLGDKKLSVSIVTATPVSTLFHFGVNIDASGAPVNAIGLKDLEVDATELGEEVLKLWSQELQGMEKARCKVAPR